MTQLMNETKLPTLELIEAGQSPWLDFISRDLLNSGKLASYIKDKGLLGVTSNPSIFQKAITTPGAGYESDVAKFFARGATTFEVYDALTIQDIQDACDAFASVFKKSKEEHGFVSLEVDPGLADDEETTVREAARLFKAVNRPNVMIKVPATGAGVRAFRRIIAKGINVNVTLMFSLSHYRDVARAYLDGLADFKRKGGDLRKVHSVASVFVSRFDTLLDKRLEDLAQKTPDQMKKAAILELRGKTAVANAKLIYGEFVKYFSSTEFQLLKESGAWTQKLLWGSTSTKKPEYNDLMYVEPLIGPETVNTLPLPTFEALLDHGKIEPGTAGQGLEDAYRTVEALSNLGISLEETGRELQKAGAESFCEAFDILMRTLERLGLDHRKGIKSFSAGNFQVNLSPNLAEDAHVTQVFEKAEKENYLARLLKKDPTLWKSHPDHQKVILNRLGWLYSVDWILGKLHEVDRLAEEIAGEGIKSIVLLGMGGSSLAPEVLSLICKKNQGRRIAFHVLDTTDPASLFAVEKNIKLKTSLFIVASKSGGTVETMSQFQYFYAKVFKGLANDGIAAGRHFIAITDCGSGLAQLALERRFRKVWINPTDIGGRYSALSYFGIVPAILAGIPVRGILKSAAELLSVTIGEAKVRQNPAIGLGCVLGSLARYGKNKVTFWTSKSLQPMGAWLEQLIAESTGKEGRGILPVESEPFLKLAEYGEDRVFVVLKLKGDSLGVYQKGLTAVRRAGYPVIEMQLDSTDAVGAEFLRWEIATAIASAVLEVNPFDEPNVKESKDLTGQFLVRLEKTGKLPDPALLIKMGRGFPGTGKSRKTLEIAIDAWRGQLEKGSYVSLLCYTERSKPFEAALTGLRKGLAASLKVPVVTGFGPRYLHSIGQFYKGGPRNGLFILFYPEETKDAAVPGVRYRFGQLKKAQALGDLSALSQKKLPVLAVNLSKNPLSQLTRFGLYLNQRLAKRKGK